MPVTVSVKVPVGVAASVVMVSVVVQVGLHDVGEKVAVAPAGRPDAVKETACVEPDERVEVMVVTTEFPCWTERLPPLARKKSKDAGGV